MSDRQSQAGQSATLDRTDRFGRQMTPTKNALLSCMYHRERQTWTLGLHPSHRTRMLRELQEAGYVYPIRTRGAWGLTKQGERQVEAWRDVE